MALVRENSTPKRSRDIAKSVSKYSKRREKHSMQQRQGKLRMPLEKVSKIKGGRAREAMALNINRNCLDHVSQSEPGNLLQMKGHLQLKRQVKFLNGNSNQCSSAKLSVPLIVIP